MPATAPKLRADVSPLLTKTS